MSNSYFRFKQFTIAQEHCAMKVSTDACIQGAWTPCMPGVQKVLDVGTGTGLLALMLAQRNPGIQIDAIELDEQAAQQAKENVANAPWTERINVVTADVRTYTTSYLYDFAICNPPFFQNSLLGDETPRNMARHTLSLSYKDLIDTFERVLQTDGYACVMLPFTEYGLWEKLLQQNNWNVFKKLIVRHRENGMPTRVISLCSRKYFAVEQEEVLIIKDSNEQYTASFIALLQPYYLKL